jgi:hypothetical protein
MDISKCLEQLRKELEHLDAAIVSLERLQQKGLRGGRPSKTRPDRPKLSVRPDANPRKQARRDRSE